MAENFYFYKKHFLTKGFNAVDLNGKHNKFQRAHRLENPQVNFIRLK